MCVCLLFIDPAIDDITVGFAVNFCILRISMFPPKDDMERVPFRNLGCLNFNIFMTLCSLQSTSPSHSVGANYQKVLSLMKYHNPLLCGAAASNIAKGTVKKKTGGKESKKTKTPSPGASKEELQGLLKALEEEFGHLAL